MKSKLKTVLNYQDSEIRIFRDMKRIEVERHMLDLKGEIDEENESGGRFLVFVYYGGRCVVIDGKKHTLHGIEVEKKNHFDIDSWLDSLED